MPARKILLRSLSAMALVFALAGPLAAFEVDVLRFAPTEPTSDDPIAITVTGVSETPCFSFQGVQRFGQNIEIVFFGCQILPPRADTPFTFTREVGPLPSGIYHVRVTIDGNVRGETHLIVLSASGSCIPDAAALCLTGRRFRVEVAWTANGRQGEGQALQLTGETGAFTFFHPDNVEVVVKVLDTCQFDTYYWVFAAGLTNLDAVLTITDTVTGAVRTYRNPAGTPYTPVQDIHGFLCSST
jgi:hypothetical protein